MGDVPASTTPQQQDARTLAQHSSATPRVAVAHTYLPFYHGLLGIEPQQPDATARSKRQRRPRAPPVQLPHLLLQLPPHTTLLQHTYQLQNSGGTRSRAISPPSSEALAYRYHSSGPAAGASSSSARAAPPRISRGAPRVRPPRRAALTESRLLLTTACTKFSGPAALKQLQAPPGLRAGGNNDSDG